MSMASLPLDEQIFALSRDATPDAEGVILALSDRVDRLRATGVPDSEIEVDSAVVAALARLQPVPGGE